MENEKLAIDLLRENNQEHIIEFLNKLSGDDKLKLVKQILSTDFQELRNLYRVLIDEDIEEIEKIEPVNYVEKSKLKDEELKKYNDIGKKIITNNKFAVITMAGGQGTRLGHKGPKGTFMLDLKEIFGKEVSIFEVLAQNFIKARDKYNVDVTWYIMTSVENKQETEKFFKNNNYFGLLADNIIFFTQNDIPVIDEEGKILFGSNYLIKTASNGNGGLYEVLDKQGILDDMNNRGIEWIFVSGVDNILVNLIDPVFIGLTIDEDNLIASKTIKKIDANEKVGVFCKKNDRVGVIEYNEISEELRKKTNDNGDLLYGQANIISHLYNIKALEYLKDINLRYHKAHKKGSYLDKNFQEIYPLEPNIYKFEKFIFDAFEYFIDMSILSVLREDEFAPIKNAEGKDSPETAINLYKNKYKKYLGGNN